MELQREIEIDGKTYGIDSMNVFTQFHVARRLSVLAPAILGYLQTPVEERNQLTLFYSMTDAFSALPENDVNYVLTHCLAVVKRKQDAGGWAKIQTDAGLMFDDITMPQMLKLIWEVILKDIASFFPTGQAILETASPPV